MSRRRFALFTTLVWGAATFTSLSGEASAQTAFSSLAGRVTDVQVSARAVF